MEQQTEHISNLQEVIGLIATLEETDETTIQRKALREYTMRYFPNSLSNPSIKKAVYRKNDSEYYRVAAKNEGKEFVLEKIPCYVLEEGTTFQQKHYRIFAEGQIKKVPEHQIELEKE